MHGVAKSVFWHDLRLALLWASDLSTKSCELHKYHDDLLSPLHIIIDIQKSTRSPAPASRARWSRLAHLDKLDAKEIVSAEGS
jgi:hypothetical protein